MQTETLSPSTKESRSAHSVAPVGQLSLRTFQASYTNLHDSIHSDGQKINKITSRAYSHSTIALKTFDDKA